MPRNEDWRRSCLIGSRKTMTVCVAALCCASNKTAPAAVVLAADRMLTGGATNMEFEHPQPKIELLVPTSAVMISGDAALSEEIIRAARQSLQHGGVGVVDAVAALAQAFQRIRQEKIEQTVLRAIGLSWPQFHDRGVQVLGGALHTQIVQQILNINLQVDLLVAGLEGSEARIGLVTHPGTIRWLDRPGFAAIGSGGTHAQIALASSGQAPSAALAECIYRVYEAKRRAETAPGVGPSTDMLILRSGSRADPSVEVGDGPMRELERLYIAARTLPAADYKTLARFFDADPQPASMPTQPS